MVRDDETAETTTSMAAYSSRMLLRVDQDRAIMRLRKWIHEVAHGGPEWGPLGVHLGPPAVLPSSAVFDVYESHTKNCVICQKTIKNINMIRNISLAVSASLGLLLRGWRGLFSAVAFTSFALLVEKFKRMYYVYEFSHQDNN